MSMTEFLNRYWTDIVLLAAMFVIAVVFVVIHLLERSARKKSVPRGNPKGAIDYEKPDFDVDHGDGISGGQHSNKEEK